MCVCVCEGCLQTDMDLTVAFELFDTRAAFGCTLAEGKKKKTHMKFVSASLEYKYVIELFK